MAEALRRRIRSGEFAPGDRLPSRSQVADEYRVGLRVAQRSKSSATQASPRGHSATSPRWRILQQWES
ncbi:GntR family transcriptional regulator [Embleya sp. NPDC050154]|uniref:GntR family transcriptional regulator n=1 Tax=Embleya sp. NPDC050154 TaxID=3363988 RepID=UPI0037AF2E1D